MLGLPTTPWRAAPWTTDEALVHAPAAGSWREIGSVRHVFTHFSLDLRVMSARAGGADGKGPGPLVWKARNAAAADTPSLFRKALELL
jgi:A/G-specific adenine glycosylase